MMQEAEMRQSERNGDRKDWEWFCRADRSDPFGRGLGALLRHRLWLWLTVTGLLVALVAVFTGALWQVRIRATYDVGMTRVDAADGGGSVVRVSIPYDPLGRLAAGQPVDLELGGVAYSGRLEQVSRAEDRLALTVRLDAGDRQPPPSVRSARITLRHQRLLAAFRRDA